MIGERFNRYTVVELSGVDKYRSKIYICKCDCGNLRKVRGYFLKSGITKSCGCYHRDIMATVRRTHGAYKTREYSSWNSMKDRCLNKRCAEYHYYGGRGITVCSRWLKFENFLADMGKRPPNTSLDRINNDGNYEPGNCRWASRAVQSMNQRKKTHCGRGHLFTPENTYHRTKINGYIDRQCKICIKEAGKAYRLQMA